MHAVLMFPSSYIRAADLQGKDVTLTICSVKIETLTMQGGRKEKKPVIRFTEMEKRGSDKTKALVCNKTNAKTIIGLYGTETDDWIGRKITLYPTVTKFGKETHECIRIRDIEHKREEGNSK
jgi:hypothetical protein